MINRDMNLFSIGFQARQPDFNISVARNPAFSESRIRCDHFSSRLSGEQGIAMLMALFVLTFAAILGFYLFLNSTTELRISDNDEARIRARAAAEAGINHARALLKGLSFDDLLKGPDGTYDSSPSYLTQAKTYGFRNPLPLSLARFVNIEDPAGSLGGMADDGIVNSGSYSGVNGTPLIPLAGVSIAAGNPYGSGTIDLSRYFVRVTDNNGEDSEIARDSADNPFYDGDGMIIVRSTGVSRTFRDVSGSVVRANAVVVYEARYRIQSQFDLPGAIVLEGTKIKAKFPDKDKFLIDGGENCFGIAAINPEYIDEDPDEDNDYDDTADGDLLEKPIVEHLHGSAGDHVTGRGLISRSVEDVTAAVAADHDQAKIFDPDNLWDFVTNKVPQFADNVLYKKQEWDNSHKPDLGNYDITKPHSDPSQHPRVTYVDGSLKIKGNISGGGLLVVKGKLTVEGAFDFNGLILVIGKGKVTLKSGAHLNGALVQMGIKQQKNGKFKFSRTNLKIEKTPSVIYNRDAVRAAHARMPIQQISIREIKSSMDP